MAHETIRCTLLYRQTIKPRTLSIIFMILHKGPIHNSYSVHIPTNHTSTTSKTISLSKLDIFPICSLPISQKHIIIVNGHITIAVSVNCFNDYTDWF